MATRDERLDVSEIIRFNGVLENFHYFAIFPISKMFDASLEGEMTVSSGGRTSKSAPGDPGFSTLDEPIKETFVS
jgi:hypothetical protein